MGGRRDAPGRFSASVPARAEMTSTLRAFASAIARHYGFEEDVVEDVKLAVSEACTDPIEAGVTGRIELDVRDDGGALVYEVRSASWDPGRTTALDVSQAGERRWLDRTAVVTALFDDAERWRDGDRSTLRFSTASRAASNAT